jgi:hypothetical protein
MDQHHLNLVLLSFYPGPVGLADPGGGVLHHQLPARSGSPSIPCHLNLVLLSLYPGSVGLADPGGGVLHHQLPARSGSPSLPCHRHASTALVIKGRCHEE